LRLRREAPPGPKLFLFRLVRQVNPWSVPGCGPPWRSNPQTASACGGLMSWLAPRSIRRGRPLGA